MDATLLAQALYDSRFGDAAAAANAEAHSFGGSGGGGTEEGRGVVKPGYRSRCELPVALGAFEARMMGRAAGKVAASRKASLLLHSW